MRVELLPVVHTQGPCPSIAEMGLFPRLPHANGFIQKVSQQESLLGTLVSLLLFPPFLPVSPFFLPSFVLYRLSLQPSLVSKLGPGSLSLTTMLPSALCLLTPSTT